MTSNNDNDSSQSQNNITPEDQLVENEPYLGPAWAVAMFILYMLKEAFPADTYSFLWWFQNYIVILVVLITIFTLVKRHQFYRESLENKNKKEADKK